LFSARGEQLTAQFIAESHEIVQIKFARFLKLRLDALCHY